MPSSFARGNDSSGNGWLLPAEQVRPLPAFQFLGNGLLILYRLLDGPTTHIEHDEADDGSFKDLTGSLPLPMLTYFSSTIRKEYRVSIPPLSPPLASQTHDTWSEGHRQSQTYYMASVSAPTRVRIIGGDPTAHLDMIHWMTSCCQQHTIIPLSSVIASPTRFILAMTSIRILAITMLDHELPNLVKRLENEMVDIDTAGRIFASGDNVLPEVRKSICTCIAGYFFAGRLQDIDRWMYLGKMNRRFDDGVCRVLGETGDSNKLEIWKRKDAQAYYFRSMAGSGEQGSSSFREEYARRMPGRLPPSDVRVDQPENQPYAPAPRPPPPQISPHVYWQQPGQPPYREFEYDSVPPRSLKHQTYNELRPMPERRTPSPSTTFSRSPSPRTRRVHFDDPLRAPHVPTPPLVGAAPFETRGPALLGPQYQPYVNSYYQQPIYPSHYSFLQQNVPRIPYHPSRPYEYPHGAYSGGEYYHRYQ